MNPRRERFKQAMSRFEPSGDPAQALKGGLYVEQPGQSIAARTFGLLELRPKSSHLVAGASGTGKTTQLRLLEQRLQSHEELTPIFVDFSVRGKDLSRPGLLVDHLATQVQQLTIASRRGLSLGLQLLGVAAHVLGTGGSTAPNLAHELALAPRKPVLLLDSLDRLPIEVFGGLCSGDLSRLREHLSVVVVGPPTVMYGAAREIVDGFDYFSRQPTYDPARGGLMHRFLTEIVRQRAGEELIPDESCVVLVEASGGILRDLIALAQLALEEAYVAGRDKVEPDDVHRAVDTFGRKHIVGLDSRELQLLRRLRKTGKFVRVTDGDASLLITRRVLEYADERGTPHFAIHPTLIPLLDHVGDL